MPTARIASYISVAAIFASSLLLQGFWFGYSKKSCKDLRSEIVDLSKDQQDSDGYTIIKIYDPTEISRTETRVVCKGLGSFTNGDQLSIKYQVFKDREGEWMFFYEQYLDDYSKISCEDLRKDIVELTKDQQDSDGYTLIKIYDPTEISRTETKVVCKGLGSFTNGDQLYIKYQVFKDREGEWMLFYEQYLDDYSKISCEDLRSEIVNLSKDQQDSDGYIIIKIYDPTEISRTETRVVCRGLGSFTNGKELPLKYQVFKDREGEWMIEYKTI